MEPISGSLQTLGSFRRTHVTTRNQAIRRWLSVKARGVGKSNFLIGANRNRLPGEIIVVLRYVYMELEKWTENSAMTHNVRALRSAAFRPKGGMASWKTCSTGTWKCTRSRVEMLGACRGRRGGQSCALMDRAARGRRFAISPSLRR